MPAELVLSADQVVQFERIRNASIGTLVYAPGWTNLGVDVPQGKKLQFLGPRSYYGVNIHAPGGRSLGVIEFPGRPLEGPLRVEWSIQGSEFESRNAYIATYWIMENVYSTPDLFVPATTPLLLIEKSGDLTNWHTVGAIGETLGSNSFYRIRVGRNTPPDAK